MAESVNHKELLDLARKRFREAEDAEKDIREEARKDLRFLSGDQWDPQARVERELANRPALVINKLPTFVQQVVNDSRQNKPSIKTSPVDSGIDKDTSDVFQGLIRHIEYDSDAEVAYQTAIEYAASCGMGAFRILTRYCGDEDFDQEIKIEAIPDPFCVYFDPFAQKADRSDARYCFVIDRLSRDEFKERWPDSETVTSNFYEGDRDEDEWITQDGVRVAEYWYIKTQRRKLLYLESTGQTVFEGDAEIPEGVEATRSRIVLQKTVHCATINGAEVLEEDEWPGQWIPIVPVYGKEMKVDGKRKLYSLIRFARDPQQLFNYYKTAQAEAVGLAPKAPYIGVEGQFEGHEQKWRTANTVPYAYLEYKNISVGGVPVGPPQRNVYEPPIQALSVGAMQSADDIKATTGIFDASLGAKSNETSGIAITRRQQEGDTANFHFVDNLARGQRHAGRILVDLIPKIYDTEREVRILGEDEKQRVVRVNAAYQDENGRLRNYDLSAGKYDVTISTGPSYTSKRQEAFGMMTEFARAWPQLFQVAGDIVFRNSDIPGADELADRIKKTLPPNLADDDKGNDAQIPPQVQAQLQALSEQNQQLTQALNQANSDASTKRLELESRERIAALNAQVELIKTQAKLGSDEALALLQHELSAINQRLEQLNANEPIEELQPAA